MNPIIPLKGKHMLFTLKPRLFFLFFTLLFLLSNCTEVKEEFIIADIKPQIIQNGKKWSQALKSQDLTILEDLYDKEAHYLPDNDNTLHGNAAITSYWKASFGFVKDIHLNMYSLEGTKELLYENGTGKAIILNQKGGNDTLQFKYVNVWKLNRDGQYRVVIDMFNDIKK